MFLLRLAAHVTRPLLPVHDVATAYDAHMPQFIDDRRPGGWVATQLASWRERAPRQGLVSAQSPVEPPALPGKGY